MKLVKREGDSFKTLEKVLEEEKLTRKFFEICSLEFNQAKYGFQSVEETLRHAEKACERYYRGVTIQRINPPKYKINRQSEGVDSE